MTLLNRLLPWTAPRPLRPPRRRLPDWVDAEPGPAEDLPCGCGWFDSSHALLTGLSVREHDTPDEIVAALPLGRWIELHLAGWQPPPPPRPAPSVADGR